jgi:hypothetical protein
MNNPYNVPDLHAVRIQHHQLKEAARMAVRGPAIALISVASFGLLVGLLALAADMVLLAVGAAEHFPDPELKRMQIVIRSIWGLVMVANAGFIIWAGISMLRLQQHQLCWLAAILACIPAIGPCFCLGIPFGIWAITVLNRSEVSEAFDR